MCNVRILQIHVCYIFLRDGISYRAKLPCSDATAKRAGAQGHQLSSFQKFPWQPLLVVIAWHHGNQRCSDVNQGKVLGKIFFLRNGSRILDIGWGGERRRSLPTKGPALPRAAPRWSCVIQLWK